MSFIGFASTSFEGSSPGPSVDLVVTRYRESVAWVEPYAARPGWRAYLYNTGKKPLPAALCALADVACAQIPNAGYEWHGYLRHIVDRYDRLAALTIFLQADPLTVSPDVHCLLNQTAAYAPVQVLSWVQQAKRKMELFTECTVSHLGGCRVWVEPVTSGLRPMLHGDRWLHKACRMAKRMKGSLFQWLASQLGGDPARASGDAAAHKALWAEQVVPPRLYRAYGAQFGVARGALLARPRGFYERLLKWLVTPNDDMARAGFLAVWRAYTTKEKAILLELIWMSLLGAERHVARDVCAECVGIAARLPKPPDATGPSCTADYFTGAPRVERCNASGDGWGGHCCRPPQPSCGDHCGRLNVACETTANDYELPRGHRFRDVK